MRSTIRSLTYSDAESGGVQRTALSRRLHSFQHRQVVAGPEPLGHPKRVQQRPELAELGRHLDKSNGRRRKRRYNRNPARRLSIPTGVTSSHVHARGINIYWGGGVPGAPPLVENPLLWEREAILLGEVGSLALLPLL